MPPKGVVADWRRVVQQLPGDRSFGDATGDGFQPPPSRPELIMSFDADDGPAPRQVSLDDASTDSVVSDDDAPTPPYNRVPRGLIVGLDDVAAVLLDGQSDDDDVDADGDSDAATSARIPSASSPAAALDPTAAKRHRAEATRRQ